MKINVDMTSKSTGLVYFPESADVHHLAKDDGEWYCETYHGAFYGKTVKQAIAKALADEGLTGSFTIHTEKDY